MLLLIITVFWAKMITNPLPEEFFSEPIGPRIAKKSPKKRGAPTKTYEGKGRTQQTAEVNKVMAASKSTIAHIQASNRMAKADGLDSTAALLKKLAKSEDPEATAKNLLQAEKDSSKIPVNVETEYALFHLLLTDSTKSQYIQNKKANKEHNSKIWPHYGKLLKLKKQLLAFGGMEFAEDGSTATSDMQKCLNNQMSRLVTGKLKSKMRAIKRKEPNIKFVLDFKVGADGSSSHSEHQNKG